MNNAFINIIMVLISLFLISLCLTGCSGTIINSNPYYQTNYDDNCIRNGVTWSELVLCQQKNLEQEWSQNNITNELLDNK